MNKKTYGNDLWNIITKEAERLKSSDPELEDFQIEYVIAKIKRFFQNI